MKKFLSDFKEFAMRGNVIDMAIGVVIGAAFKAIVDSLVADIITPFIGLFANQDLSDKVFMIKDVAIKYGSFISAIINFVLMAFVIFIIVKMLNRVKGYGKKEVEVQAEATTKSCPHCLSEVPLKATRCMHCTSNLDK
jgi:large conductance mechanosensitive channel